MKITITECGGNYTVWGPTEHRTSDPNIAIRRAINKHWSKRHEFYHNHGVQSAMNRTRYGQIGHSVGNNTSSMDTMTIRVDID